MLEAGLTEKIDDIDVQIINLLQKDSRLSFNRIAKKLGIAVGTARNRIKNLENKRVLRGYTVIVDPNTIGYNLTAIILVQAEGKNLLKVENEVAKMNNVISVYDITGDFDFFVIARFENSSSLNTFIKNLLTIPYIKKTVTNVVLNIIKEDFNIKTS